MAKAKKKVTGYDRELTEYSAGWSWKIGDIEFVYNDNVVGINLFVIVLNEQHALTYAKTLAEAGFVAEGFAAGWNGRQRMTEGK